MTPTQFKLYCDIITADSSCECEIVCNTPGCSCAKSIHMPIADAAIRDHLHTRLAFWHRFFVQAEPNVDRVLVWVAGEHGPTPRGHYIGPSKLSALLVAHAARLGVPVPKEIDDDPLV